MENDRTSIDPKINFDYTPSKFTHRDPKTVVDNFYQIFNQANKDLPIEKITLLDLDDTGRKQVYNQPQASSDRDGNILEIIQLKDKEKEIKGQRSKNIIHLYIPGGYWQAMDRYKYRSFATHLAYQNDQNIFCLLGYEVFPKVTSMDGIVYKISQGLERLAEYLEEVYPEDETKNNFELEISGHCAGAQLIILALNELFSSSKEDENDDLLPFGFINPSSIYIKILKKSITKLHLFSGIYDLRPLVFTEFNGVIEWNDEEAWNFSPMKVEKNFNNLIECLKKSSANLKRISFFVGFYESQAFKNQSEQMCEEINKIYFSVKNKNIINNNKNKKLVETSSKEKSLAHFKIIGQVDHFSLLENMLDDDYLRSILRII